MMNKQYIGEKAVTSALRGNLVIAWILQICLLKVREFITIDAYMEDSSDGSLSLEGVSKDT